MVRLILFSILSLLPILSWTAPNSLPIQFEKASVNINDFKSIENGGKQFAMRCMVCHSVKYLRYNKLAQKVGVTYDKMPIDQSKWTLGSPPPDLSLTARVRGADWLYTYLHSFYEDKSTATGSNNLLVPNTSMANPFIGIQGVQVLVKESDRQHASSLFNKPHWFDKLILVKSGSMSPEQFNQLMNDIVNFLVYASEPHASERVHLGYWVLGFLIILAILAYFLKKEFWRDVDI